MEIICLLLGIVLGIVIKTVSYHLNRRKTANPPIGDLVIDKSSSTIIPYLALEPGTDLASIPNRKRVTLVTQVVKNSRK